MYANKNISSKYLQSFHLSNDIQAVLIEVHLKQGKLLVVSIYTPPDQKLAYFLSSITDLIDHYLKTYEDFIVIGDFNEIGTSPALDSFLDEQNCKNIIKNKTCFKSVKGSCIDLILQVDRVYINLQTCLREELATIIFCFTQCLSLPIPKWSQKFFQRDVLRTFQKNHFCKIENKD